MSLKLEWNDELLEKEIALIMLESEQNYCKHFYLQVCKLLKITHIFTLDNYIEEPEWIYNIRKKNNEIYYGILDEKRVKLKDMFCIVCCPILGFRKYYDDFFWVKGLEWGEDYIDSVYILQYYKKKFCIDISKKNVWIFGAGKTGKYFYEQHKEIYAIKGFISNYESETEFLGLPVIRPKELRKKKDIYVIICSIAEEVMTDKLWEFDIYGCSGFCFMDTSFKKMLVAMGTCQVVSVTNMLDKQDNFKKNYDGFSCVESIYALANNVDYVRIIHYGKYCDVVFYNRTNPGTLEGRNYEHIIKRYYPSAQRISMPFYHFTGQLIQAVSANPYYLRYNDAYRKNGLGYWFCGDKFINQMIEENMHEEEIMKTICSEDYWSESEVKEYFEKELKKVEVLDRFSDIPIKVFIENNYTKKVFFVDGVHFSNYLRAYITVKLAGLLNITLYEKDILEKEFLEFSMPIYPCVKKVLHMEVEETTGYLNAELWQTENISFEEYQRRYIQYIKNIKQIKETVGTVLF